MDIQFPIDDPENSVRLERLELTEGDMFGCKLVVEAGGFHGGVDLWLERFALRRFLDGLRAMDSDLKGEALFQPLWEPDHVLLVMERTGGIVVSGELGSQAFNYLRFTFRTDQTVLRPLIRSLDSIISSATPSG